MSSLSRLRFRAVMIVASAAACLSTAVSPLQTEPSDGQIKVTSRPIVNFHIGRDETRFGALEFVGGLEMTSRSDDFGALSSFRFLKPGSDLLGVTDTGFWLFATVTRDAGGKPTGLAHVRMTPILDVAGKAGAGKAEIDAEALAVKDGVATVGFEHNHRIAQYLIDPDGMKAEMRELDFVIPARELRQNRGIETVTHAPANGRHEGGLVIVAEKSLDSQGNIFAAIIEGPHKGIFTVRRHGGFDITDGVFLDNGDLLLLERSFSMTAGVKMRLRRIPGDSVAKGKVVDGPVLFEADMGYQIDNMEGLDAWTRDDGAQMLSLVSDDNLSMLQRSLYLEFILHED